MPEVPQPVKAELKPLGFVHHPSPGFIYSIIQQILGECLQGTRRGDVAVSGTVISPALREHIAKQGHTDHEGA